MFLSIFRITFISIIYNIDSMSIFLSIFITTFISIIYNIDSTSVFLSMFRIIACFFLKGNL